jgi:hypothetical protein
MINIWRISERDSIYAMKSSIIDAIVINNLHNDFFLFTDFLLMPLQMRVEFHID